MKKNDRTGFWAALEGNPQAQQPSTAGVTPSPEPHLRQEPSLHEPQFDAQEPQFAPPSNSPLAEQPSQQAAPPVGPQAASFSQAAQSWSGYAAHSAQNMPPAQSHQAGAASVSGASTAPADKFGKAKVLLAGCKDLAGRIPKPRVPSKQELKDEFHRKSRRVQLRLRTFPWQNTAQVLLARFKEDRLGVTASSLTFTSLLALVPFFTVALALFTAFPIFGKAQLVLERWLMDSLIPETIARQVLGYLTQFASKASQLGLVGFSILMVTALALILTIDRTLNNIWRVRQLRPLGQRVLIYWAAITLGPLLLGLSLVLSSYVMSASKGLVNALPGSLRFVFDSIEFVVLAAGMAGLYHYVPNTPVRWRHAMVGGVFVAVFMEVAKKALGIYLSSVPTYSVIYGAFATLPILLIWMYVAWSIVLTGALVTAYLPTILSGVERMTGHRGWQFELAVEVLQCLAKERELPHKGLFVHQLSRRLRIEASQIQPVLQALAQLDWVGAVQPPDAYVSLESTEPRYVLLVDPRTTLVEPLVQRLLLQPSEAVQPLWQRAQLDVMTLAELIAAPMADIHRVDEIHKTL
ncbi:YihY family inner membrane protein [Comamonas sp. 26]|uniref:YihY family inner membrane protein n=1 Tax=Comamonas sp. 26 TaxID=2035201 RepID=UPI000C49DA27|nr:YihY family inner membrane protein [Comamonas sp. 26]PIG08325.1 membrane protein [Comamonas sp. 26]